MEGDVIVRAEVLRTLKRTAAERSRQLASLSLTA
jgi:hypothetical protein